ncbi:phytanoyl-CoA dioxygenase family protein [Micromonospora mirobrigensis]|uniref:Phytanoyl-CoA dioxygenase (PhyH) n=1 Tax=Micromonospora mirobrigensis TaxID=262898 RepID=A0A1C4WQY9_9ACTN|nr:phytanoyl-CoA dioxygenase family protein [Micromonospora mirobrigensis]SCE98321.1 Phytanoyl-CoA dioxygenase (PhyH) [Micromonospora mirobrigensis]
MTTTLPTRPETTGADLRAQFLDRGYLLLRGVLDADGVARARELIADRLTGRGEEEMLTSEFLQIRELAEIPLRDEVVSTVRRLVDGPPALYPNCTARKNVYVPLHVDDTFVGPGREYAWEPDFVHVQGGLYLQDNDPVTGGAIDVVRGSHLMSFDGYGRVPADFDTPNWTVGASSLRETLDIRAGDVVLWHGRLMHASTPVQVKVDRQKYGVFFSYGRQDLRDNSRFLTNLAANRVRTMNGISGVIPRLAEIARLRFPNDFPDWFRCRAASAGIHVPTL